MQATGVGMGAFARQLARQALFRSSRISSPGATSATGGMSGMPAVVHQSSSPTRAAAARQASISASVQCRGDPSWCSETIAATRPLDEHRCDDLRRKAAVDLAHAVEGRIVERLRAVVLDDLPPLLRARAATGCPRRSTVRSSRSEPAPGASASCVTGKA